MKKAKFFINILLTAVLALNQAVFLLAPDIARAESLTLYFADLPATSVFGNVNITIKTSIEVGEVRLYGSDPYLSYGVSMSHQTGTNLYTYILNTALLQNGIKDIYAKTFYNSLAYVSNHASLDVQNTTTTPTATAPTTATPTTTTTIPTTPTTATTEITNNTTTADPSTIIFPDTTTEETADSTTYYILTLNFKTPPAIVSGSAVFYVETSEEADVVFYVLKDGTVLNKYPSVYQGNKIYYFKWDASNLSSGRYTIKAFASKSGYIDVNRQIDVLVENTQPLEITFVEAYQPPFAGDKKISVSLSREVDNVVFTIEGVKNEKWNGVKMDAKNYYFIWHTADFPNNYYKVTANAMVSGAVSASKSFSAQTENKTAVETNITTTTASNLLEPLIIMLVEKLMSPIMGDVRITAKVNQKVDKVEFKIEGPKSELFAGIKLDDNHYNFIWPTIKFPNGFYKLNIFAYQGKNTAAKYDSVEIKNAVNQEIKSPEINKEPTDQILPECKAKNINTPEECVKYMSIPPECRGKNLTKEECGEYMSIPPECRDRSLSKEECDKFMSVAPECRKQGIIDQEACKKFMYKYAMPVECQKAGATTQEYCGKIIFINSLPPECQKVQATTQEECDKIMRNRAGLTPECDKANINDPDKCNLYMAENFMPAECKQAGIASKEECDYFLRNKYGQLNNTIKTEFRPVDFSGAEAGGLTVECRQADVNSKEECGKYMEVNSLPEECRSAGAKTKAECEKIMFLKHAPQECKDAGISEAKECEKFMFKKYAPKECLEAGIATKEACNKLMFEKFGGANSIPADKLPLECQKAGVKTQAECEKTMKKLYMPDECQSQGITDEKECQKYLELKNMPEECRSVGARTRSECDKITFKKYGPEECRSAGIDDEKECQNFMFNKYAPQVQCKDVDDWQCKNSIKENYLGAIVSKQTQYAELKEKVSQRIGETASVEDLQASFESAKGIMPLTDQKANLKVLSVKEELILNDSDNLIQTAPMAVMMDSDGDGLPDDMEKRMGTDPNQSDSDNDGYSDGAEIKNNYNPAGEGEAKAEMAPIDEAIMQNQTLGQPKTEGGESEELVIASVDNQSGEQGEGYAFAGQAEPNSVVTLYIYSDLPLIATAKADEYGNWQYELSKSLNEGEHEVYVAINDNTGKVVAKSSPLNFFIKEAKAVSVRDFIAPAVSQTTKKSESSIKYFIIIAILTVVIGILLFVIFHIQRRKHLFKA